MGEKLRLPWDNPAELERLKEADAAEKKGAVKATDKLKIQGGPPVSSPISKGKETIQMSDTKYGAFSYPYLANEDEAFARCFRLSEDEFLALAGGLKKYTQHRLDREKARGAQIKAADGSAMASFTVPRLPDNLEAAMAAIVLPGVKEQDFASHLLSEQMTKVAGIMGAIIASERIRAQMATQKKDEEIMRERTLRALRDEAANKFRVSSESQTAHDYAAQQYKLRQKGA